MRFTRSSAKHLKHALDLIVWDLSSVAPERGACITAQMLGATNRYKTIIATLFSQSPSP